MKKIVIANTLKPVDDVRAFEKIAQSIAKTNKYELNIIGNSGKKESNHPLIRFHVHPIQGRSFKQRLIAARKTFVLVQQLRPHILIITSHELLFAAFFAWLLKDTKVVYDIQEDYKKNIIHLSGLPNLLSNLLGNYVRLREQLSQLFISQYWLAEKCYQIEIPLPKNKHVVLENKAKEFSCEESETDQLRLLFTGTISHYAGIDLALAFYKKMAEIVPDSTLRIVGQCHDKKLREELFLLASNESGINVLISENVISHRAILDEIFQADLGIISYKENKVNREKVPTKLYEYSRYGLSYVLERNTSWEIKSLILGGSIPIDFEEPDIAYVLKKLEEYKRRENFEYPHDQTWESQEGILINSLSTLDS